MSDQIETQNQDKRESFIDNFAGEDVNLADTKEESAPTEQTESVDKPLAVNEEVKEEVKEEEKKKEREAKFVPIQALDEARHKEREAKARAEVIERESNERFSKLEARLERMINPPPEIPKYEDNPAENLRLRQDQIENEARARFETLDKQTEEFNRGTQRVNYENELTSIVTSAEVEYAKSNPDYLDAAEYLKGVSDRNLIEMGVSDQDQRKAIIRQQILEMSSTALQQGRNPAEVAHRFAKNYGFVAKVDVEKAEKQIENISKGQSTASMGSGGKTNTTLSLKALEQMSDEEFDAALDDKSWAKLMRG